MPIKPIDELGTNAVFTDYKRGAKKRSLELSLTKLEFKNLILDNCYYCDSPPSNVKRRRRGVEVVEFKYNGIDRVNSGLGYTLENCVTCCMICNHAKTNMTQLEWYQWINRLTNNFGNALEFDATIDSEVYQWCCKEGIL